MTMRALAGMGLTALLLGGTMIGGIHGGGAASASTRDASAAARQSAAKALKALAKGHALKAVPLAETAVALQPEDASYRALLGQAYLLTGRFASASTAFTDVLALSPTNGKAALNLALAQIAEGQWDTARKTLESHADTIPASDRGLAVALAGDPATGVDILIAATRTPEADGKTRQNLALAMALAGRWKEARTIVGTDMAPADADARIIQWAAFAKPVGAADQVAALLGVVPVKDPGQPVALALNATVPVVEQAAAEPVEAAAPQIEPVAMTTVEPNASVEVAAVEAPLIPTPAVTPAPVPGGVSFGERREFVQALAPVMIAEVPVRTIPAKGAFKTRVVAFVARPHTPAKGNFYVQLGAYDNAGVAKDAWSRAKRRYAAFAAHTPAGMAFRSKDVTFYRLSIGGFARADAAALCRTYRAKGGACFVRSGAGDQTATWVKPVTKKSAVLLASK